jgi:cold shock CspA family protein
MNGTIVKYFEDREYGFILGYDKNDYFFHLLDVKTFLPEEGRVVEFMIKQTGKGLQAKDIEMIDGRGGIPNSRRIVDVWNKNVPNMIRSHILGKYINQFITIEGFYGGAAKGHENSVYLKDLTVVGSEEDGPVEHILLLNHMQDYFPFWNQFNLETPLIISGIVYYYYDADQVKYSLYVNIADVRPKYLF